MMDMEEMANLMMREVTRQISLIARPRFSTVTSYDPSSHAIKVQLEPEGITSGWIPVKSQGASKTGVSHQTGPSVGSGAQPGDQAFIMYAEGDPESAVCLGFTHNDVDQPPGAKSGEDIVQHNPSGVKRLLSAVGHFITAPKTASSVISQTITHFAQDLIGDNSAKISHTADNDITHTSNKGNITHTASMGNITHSAPQGNITHSAPNGTISLNSHGGTSLSSAGGLTISSSGMSVTGGGNLA